MVYQLNERTLLRSGFGLYFDNLNLNELQFTRLVPPFSGRYDASPTGTQLVNVADLYPDPRLAATFPTPFSMNPDNVSAYVRQWNVNVQRTFGREYIVEVAYTGSQSRHEHKRFNLNQPTEGTAPQAQRLPYPQFAPALLTSSDTGHGDFNGISVRVDKRFSGGLFFTGSYQFSKNQDNNSGEIEANDTAFAWDHEADWAFSRTTALIAAPSASAMTCPGVSESAGSLNRGWCRACSVTGSCPGRCGCRAACPSPSR